MTNPSSRIRLTRPVVSVVEQGDVPVWLHTRQEFAQCTRSFGEFCNERRANGRTGQGKEEGAGEKVRGEEDHDTYRI